MRSSSDLLALSTLLLQAIYAAMAHPAPGESWEYPNWNGYGNDGDVEIGSTVGYLYNNNHGLQGGSKQQAGGRGGQGGCGKGVCCGRGGSWGGGNGGSCPTVTVNGCTTDPTSTVTVTIDDGGFGSATITETRSQCTDTITEDAIPGETITKTDTLTSTISECTATTTDLVTVIEDGPTITETITTPGPTVTDTVIVIGSTITEPGSTETETVTDTVIDIETTTYTHNQIITETKTATETQTLEVTITMTSTYCSETGGGDTLDYGTCLDPTIKWAYGLDGRNHYSFTTNNQIDFPFGSDTSISSVTGLVCNRLRSPCNAPQATIDRCTEAANAANRLSGQEAADVWNEMMT
ncbi:hypothetical protein N7494_003146 [Penicillium frequentans]|uniref:Uncharacterized protein n=1 Tax=Penicillium frequentans TaxID=3151616 RepID=A0AAD6GKM7_9EURO|nr:hypothetical protein N7494_003146 [Penicillium glabrum]